MSMIDSKGPEVVWAPSTTENAPPASTKAAPLSNADVRNSYNDGVTSAYEDSFKTKFKEFHDKEQCFGDNLAREAFDARSKIKADHQAQTSTLGRLAIWVRNLFTYGGANASYSGLSKSKNPEEIAYSAFKTDGSDLGLKGNGFGEKLEVWKAIKDVTTLYPEDVTPAMIAAFKAQPRGKVDVDAILAARTDISANPALNLFDVKSDNRRHYI
ncbi:hypothetical protein [Robbsia andropogonis]|uniref:hypothetical protein n=1 Tax=Robbsia andropogonis TaxID=28092 RepID=UPI0004676932|nr:hypothetical protein [Robbsia andropogonis]